MKVPSIDQLVVEYKHTFQRFPLVMLCALAATIAALFLISRDHESEPTIAYNVLLTCILALPLLGAITLCSEHARAENRKKWLWQGAGVLLLAGYALTIPTDLYRTPMIYMFRFAALGIGSALLLSYMPFLFRGGVNGFWQFNRIIVYRVILAGAFGAVLFAGLALALAALDNLFGMDIPGETYFRLWVLIMGLFVVPFVLAGTPRDLTELDSVEDFPRSLKVFGQYVLLPLVAVYFVILYAYIGKIIATWNWPQGWVGRLILGFASAGILALFVLDPLRRQAARSWIDRATRWYYLILIPLIPVLLLALWERIGQYGITESRYLGLTIGAWLTFIAGYFLLSRTRSIKMIPASLAVVALAISFGPWGMFSVSECSQVGRLEKLLTTNGILVDSAIVKAPTRPSDTDIVEISSILAYLHEVHGYEAIQPWFAQSLREDDTVSSMYQRFKRPDLVANEMGIEYQPYRLSFSDNDYAYHIDQSLPLSTGGMEHLLSASFPGNTKFHFGNPDSDSGYIETYADSITLRLPYDSVVERSVTIDLEAMLNQLMEKHSDRNEKVVPAEELTTISEAPGIRARVILRNVSLTRENDSLLTTFYDALILYSDDSSATK